MILLGFICVLGAIGLLVAGLAQADSSLVWGPDAVLAAAARMDQSSFN